MSLFDDMLHSDESLFLDEVALDYTFLPREIPHRENEQKHIATCIKPLFSRRNGKNLLIHGTPGIGKTAAVKHVFRDLEGQTDEIVPMYINCWQKNTSFKIAIEMCHLLGYKFTHNKKTDDLLDIVIERLNKGSAVFCFDEIDKAEDLDFIYTILEKVYRRTILVITNYVSWAVMLDERIRSRLMLERLEFRKYTEPEVRDILKDRLKYAFVDGVWDDKALGMVARTSYQKGDIRTGLYLMKEAGDAAESQASKKISHEHVSFALKKLPDFKQKKSTDLSEDEKFILDLVKANSGQKIGDLYKIYQEKGGDFSYKTFQRKIEHLGKNSFISVDKTQGGKGGNTSIINYAQRKLDEY